MTIKCKNNWGNIVRPGDKLMWLNYGSPGELVIVGTIIDFENRFNVSLTNKEIPFWHLHEDGTVDRMDGHGFGYFTTIDGKKIMGYKDEN